MSSISYAAIFGVVNGVVQDPQQHPVPQADVTVRAALSAWKAQTRTDADGRFSFTEVPAGDYVVTIVKPGFQTVEQRLEVRSGSVTALTTALPLGAINETVTVTTTAGVVNPRSVTTQSLVTRDEIERTPGALRTNSLDLITQFVPGSYMVHDQLHIRGGHQVSWLVDGVPVPNTNIATTVGPQFDPKDIDTIEVQRGGYSAEFGDRTYGVFNVIPRSGFERNREVELIASYGSFQETNDQFSLGDHTDRTAYFASLNANRTNLGLETPVPESVHNRGVGVGGFGSVIHKMGEGDQFRIAANVRGDQFQIPNDPDGQAAGIDDVQRERDAFLNVSWLHTMPSAFLTISPFYHYNRAAFDGGPSDPIVTTDHTASHYLGAQAVIAVSKGAHNGRFGVYGFYQRDETLFGLQSSDAVSALNQTQSVNGNVAVAFAEDQFAATGWLTLTGGVRLTRFSGAFTETAASPRVGATIRVPQLDWVIRGYYGRYYQPPPLTTITGPLLDLAVDQGFGFLPLEGERDEQYEVGLAIPIQGWTIDLDHFHTDARNFFDHDALGNSNIFIPLTIDSARIRGWEATVRSPRRQGAQVHVAYSHQFVEGRGAVTGGLTAFEPASDDFFFLDHDQRDTLTAGVDLLLFSDASLSASVGYGSGFLEGDGPAHKPAHATVNLQASKAVGKRWTLLATALNVGDTHFLLDESNTFGGTHFNSPRQVSVGVRYRFHY
jgi:outer membrane cobalamin receptor